MDGTLDLLLNITDVILFTSPKRGETELSKQLNFFPEKFTLTFATPQDQATKAATELTRALLNPQPAAPFYQVGDAQTLALKRLAAIFEGATQHRTKNNIPPPNRITTMHLRGCHLVFRLRGCQTQQHKVCLPSTTITPIQFRTHNVV
jgi:hypothetical protein